MLRAAEGSWLSGTFLHPVMLKWPALRTAFDGVSRGSWKGAAWGRIPVQMRITLRQEEPLLAELYSSSGSGRIATGPRAGRRVARVGDAVDVEDGAPPSGRCCAAVAGYSVHAGVCVPARDRMRLEGLARYAGRPPPAGERLSLLPDGRLLYRLKHS